VGSSEVADRAVDHLAGLVENLPGAQRGDIAVRPFHLTHDGITFGLIVNSHRDVGEWADLLPNGLRFRAPWDGDYDT
jgi:formate hydrogenlyase regulatory protein HycA